MSGTQFTQLGKYAIRGVLGKGAMGTVYDGWDPVIDRRVAIKTVRLPDAQDEEATEGLARFKREAQAAGRLTHPNIVGVFDYGETDELAFIVMEFVEGRSLKDVMGANERMTTAHALAVMDDVLAGLAYSHGRGVVHRDIKPANIMITAENRAKIADFGIARIEASSMTQAGTVMGTPAYMSPEQFMGQVVDSRTDIYSCGVLLYQLLTGDRPFDGSMSAIMHKVLTTVPPRPSELVVTAPVGLDDVVAKAMARRPEDRFDTAAAFAQALRTPAEPAFASDETVVAAPRPTPRPTAEPAALPAPAKRASKLPVFIGAGVAAAALAAAGVWFALPGRDVVVPAPRQASAVVTPPPSTPAPASAPVPEVPVSAPPPVIAPPIVAPAIVPAPQPATTPAPARSASAIEAALADSLPAIRCSLTRATVAGDGSVTLAGVSGGGQPEDALRRAVAAADPAGLAWQVQSFDGPYCPALDALRPLAEAISRNRTGMELTQLGGAAPLKDNEVIALQVTMPAFAGFLHVAYLQHDATVSPQVPGPGYPEQTYAARASVALGSPRSDFEGWHVGPPFGTDMIVVVASTAPLFTRKLADSQPIATYVAALQTATADLRRRGGSVAAAALLLDTRPGR